MSIGGAPHAATASRSSAGCGISLTIPYRSSRMRVRCAFRLRRSVAASVVSLSTTSRGKVMRMSLCVPSLRFI